MSDIRESIASRLIASTIFKPVPGGYVYCAPDRVFGRSRCYLVNEAQKAAIVALTTSRHPILWQLVLWLVFALLVVATSLLLRAYTGHDNPTSADAVAIIVLAIVEAIAGLVLLLSWKLRRLRPALAGLPPTDERITSQDVQQVMKASADSASDKQLLVQGLIGVAASVAFIFSCVVQAVLGHIWTALMSGAAAILLGFTAATVLMRLMARSRERS